METNAVVLPLLRRALRDLRHAKRDILLDGRLVDLGGRVPHQTLGSLTRLLQEESVAKKALQAIAPQHVTYFTDEYQLPSHLQRVKTFRNPAAHSSSSDRAALLELRRWLLGIGEAGALPGLVRRKGEA